MGHIITPIKLGAGVGQCVVEYPVGGKVVHSNMDYERGIVLWVRHAEQAEQEHRLFIVEGPGRVFPASVEIATVVQFEIEVPAEAMTILLPGQNPNGAGAHTVVKSLLVFVLDAGETQEAITDEANR